MNFEDSTISAFYEGRSVFVTGATGFVGKVLLEKLLRSCPGIKNVYILMREKRGKDPRQRLEELMNCKVFDLLKKEHPEASKKVIGITGDLSLPELGVSSKDLIKMAESVSVVFHSAATVKFDEPLKQAVNMNVLATRRMIELCHKLPNLVAVVHVSTAYANCNRKEVDEVIYPAPIPPNQIIEATEWMEEKLLDSITPKLIGNRPNTYTFTKALAENLLIEESETLPVAIVRPSIVSASWREPFPGWIDNLNGPAGIIVAGGKGVLRTMIIYGEVVADIIPVDVVINLMIAVAWYTAVKRPKKTLVYNCVSGPLNKTSWNDIMAVTYPMLLKYPSAELFRYPKGSFRRNRYVNNVCIAFQHYLPALFVDLLAYIFFQKPGMMRVYQKVHKATDCLQFFTTRDWEFHCDNVLMLHDALSKEDKKRFFFDIRELNWSYFWENHVLGCRKFILKEDPSTIPAARKSLRRRYFVSQFTHFLVAIGVWKIFFSRILSVNNIWYAASAAMFKIQDFLQES
ncbi:fatty acyl-CoA reductase 1-like [Uloborus diversus]|uniref:fatty acyl-CoA reductase 1-like n=1 Tax=Uloborus diversus TaxID=327109 RepID=UPI0024093E96|nr:fatty acyl-CoA reductase 1-like [Uloborus diversus]XP_054708694.1 fatty acyl-CoA reductase 1-like [Uloborus diversus]XP_054708695.1 fatty acyl-CoA reductase 1-like [Uloborus diversus]XP_054708696.1 fatty acyl-CoA reductase 1-like [Uloborus diversus]